MRPAIEKKFLVANSPDSIIPSLKKMIKFIDVNLPEYTNVEDIKFKAKVILSELLNNALKHVKNAESTIHILIDDEKIDIQKTDCGNRFYLKGRSPFVRELKGNKVQINGDFFHDVFAMVNNEFNYTFICEEKIYDELANYNGLIEHFGLLIISKSADTFTYEHNPKTGLNTFKVNLLINSKK